MLRNLRKTCVRKGDVTLEIATTSCKSKKQQHFKPPVTGRKLVFLSISTVLYINFRLSTQHKIHFVVKACMVSIPSTGENTWFVHRITNFHITFRVSTEHKIQNS